MEANNPGDETQYETLVRFHFTYFGTDWQPVNAAGLGGGSEAAAW